MQFIDVDILGRPAFSVVIGPDGRYRFDGINASLTAQSGFTKASFVGHTPEECMPNAAVGFAVANYRRCFATGEMQEYEEQLEVPAGTKWWRTTLSPVLDPAGRVVQIIGLCVDITDRKLTELDLRSAAFKDPLTGICNRRRFERDLENAVARANDTSRSFAVILADVNRFKSINDTHGHGVGDEVLKTIAGRLAEGVRETDRLARIGGDEFAAIVSAATEGAMIVAVERLQRKLAGPIRVGDRDLIVGVSLGAALWQAGMKPTDVTAAADAAMYRDKTSQAA